MREVHVHVTVHVHAQCAVVYNIPGKQGQRGPLVWGVGREGGRLKTVK